MHTTTHDTAPDTLTGLLAKLAGVTEQIVTAVSARDASDVGMPTAGSILASSDRLIAATVSVLALVSRRGVINDQGLSIESWLRTFGARTVADERVLLQTVERLEDMPTVRDWFLAGALSWSVVRGIALETRNLTRAQRRWLDDVLAGDVDRVRRLDAQQLLGAVQSLANQARPDLHRDRERGVDRREYLAMQEGFDGWTSGQFQLGPEASRIVRRAINTTRPQDTTGDEEKHAAGTNDRQDSCGNNDHGPGHAHRPSDADSDHAAGGDDTGDPGGLACSAEQADVDSDHPGGGDDDVEFAGSDRWRRQRQHSNARALVALCKQRLGMPGGSAPASARPSMLIVVPIDALADDFEHRATSTAAHLLTESTHGPIELTPAAAQRLTCDATSRVVFTDGAVPLGVTAAHPKVSASLRAALIVRDGGCRFPGCPQAPDACDNHHIIPQSRGGPTTLENLALLCLAHHHAVHDSQWQARLHPDGAMTFTRRGATLTSLPRADQRFTATEPPPRGRPTRRRDPVNRHAPRHTNGDLPRADGPGDGVATHPPPEPAVPF